MVARDHLEGDALATEIGQRVGGIVTDLVGEADEGYRSQALGRAGCLLHRARIPQTRRRGGHQHHPPTRGRFVVDALAHGVAIAGDDVGGGAQQDFWRPQDPRAPWPEVGAAPLASRGERHPSRRLPVRRRRPPRADGVERGVRALFGARQGAEHLFDRLRAAAVDQLEAFGEDPAGREGSRLVDAQDVDARQPFDGRQLAHQHAATSQPTHRNSEGDAREQHEPLGDHGAHARDTAADGVRQIAVPEDLTGDEHCGDGNDQPLHDLQDAVDAVPQLGARHLEAPGFGRQPVGVGLRAHLGDSVHARARTDETPREKLLSGLFRLGL